MLYLKKGIASQSSTADNGSANYAIDENDDSINRIASQSSTAFNGPANYAIDGNYDSIYPHESCSHTDKEQDAWWKLDLGERYSICQVVITNRQDCCSERIDGAVVSVGDSSDISQNDQCGDQIDWNANTYGEKITFDCQLSGRYVAVQLKGHNNYLHLCEVEVFGMKGIPCSM
ncbi:fucolectin-6-like [Saccoglossus kowalevskii]